MANVVIDGGPACSPGQVNILYTSVVLCAPGSTTNCQTIDHVQVDTGSYGLRILSDALNPALAAALPIVNESQTGQPLAECTEFADGYSWGPIRTADMQIAGEKASSIGVQIVGDPAYTQVPGDCSSFGTQEDSISTFGANGILGVGPFVQDCGSGCEPGGSQFGYFVCPSPGSCTDTAPAFKGVMLSQQVSNPVAFFPTDNNGVIIQLPAIAAGGAPTVTGSLIFGVDTAANNASASATYVLKTDTSHGYIWTSFNSANLIDSYIDSGSNANYFADPTLTACTNNVGFYCPSPAISLSASIEGYGGTPSAPVSFPVADADTFSAANTAFDNLAGCPVSSSSSSTCPTSSSSFDWGIPFYFGRSVYTVIDCNPVDGASCSTTLQGYGPYFAF